MKYLVLAICCIGLVACSSTSTTKNKLTTNTTAQSAADSDISIEYFNKGIQYQRGIYGIPRSYPKAREYFEKSCNLGFGEGCYAAGVYYEQGVGGLQLYGKAAELYDKACRLNYGTGCSNLGALFYQGKGVAKSPLRAFRYFEAGCNMNDGVGCYNLGVMSAETKSFSKAKEYYLKSCTIGYQSGCNGLVDLEKKGY